MPKEFEKKLQKVKYKYVSMIDKKKSNKNCWTNLL